MWIIFSRRRQGLRAFHQPPVLPALLETHLQLSKDGTALNAVMHCTLYGSFISNDATPLLPKTQTNAIQKQGVNISPSFCMVQMSVSRVDESFPPLPGYFAAGKFVFLKVFINCVWGPFLESNGRDTPPTKPYLQGHIYFSFTSVKNTTDVPIRWLKDLLRLADHIDHKRIWRSRAQVIECNSVCTNSLVESFTCLPCQGISTSRVGLLSH